MYELPTTIEIENGVSYPIRNDGDFRVVLDAFSLLNDEELNKEEKIISALLVFYDDMNCVEDVLSIDNMEGAVKGMFEFFNAGRPEPKGQEKKLIDWDKDSSMIFSAVNNVAKQEVRAVPYMHWWTFMGYFASIGESTLSTVVGIRNKILTEKKLEKWERQFKAENPQLFDWNSKTADEMEAEAWLKEIWNKE